MVIVIKGIEKTIFGGIKIRIAFIPFECIIRYDEYANFFRSRYEKRR